MAAAALSVVAAAVLLTGISADRPGWDPASVDTAALERMPPAAEAMDDWTARVAARPAGGLEREGLGKLLLRHGREAGDDAAFGEAELAFREALDRIPDHLPSRLGLAQALAAQHRFGEARAIGDAIWREDPEQLEALAIVADAAIETGHYEQARTIIGTLVAESGTPASLARLARLRELEGRHDEAIALLERGAVATRDAGALGDRMAWYLMRLAGLHMTEGRLEHAMAHAEIAIEADPGHLGARVMHARVLTAQQRFDEAIAAYESLIERMPHPEILAALGDLYEVTGQKDRARGTWADVLAAGDAAGAAEDRPMTRFLADHDLRPAEAVERARRDLEARPDVHAWGNLAWALLKAGRIDEAAAAMDEARSLGTREPDMLYHAGMIASASGDRDGAIELLRDALAMSPTFDPLQAPRARAELSRLIDG